VRHQKKFLEKMVLGKKVTMSIKGKDWRGNPLAVVLVNGKKDPRVELLEEGLAWTAEKNPRLISKPAAPGTTKRYRTVEAESIPLHHGPIADSKQCSNRRRAKK
jgi:endonuclease YncB( thermonuclease family)